LATFACTSFCALPERLLGSAALVGMGRNGELLSLPVNDTGQRRKFRGFLSISKYFRRVALKPDGALLTAGGLIQRETGRARLT
jgi:hypothetical protein